MEVKQSFPVYRKYPNNKHFFQIISEKEFYQIDQIGSKFIQIHKVASNFFDIQFIYDLIENKNGHYLESNSREYQEVFEKLH